MESAVIREMCRGVGVRQQGYPGSSTRLSKLVSHLLELPMLTVVQVAVQLVTSLASWLGPNVICTLDCHRPR